MTPPLVNVVAKNRGWLFEDLKGHFAAGGRRVGVRAMASDEPLPHADAWIYLRTHEAASSPDPSRTVVQVHDMFADDYGPDGPRRCVERCGAVSLTHPGQMEILRNAGIRTPTGLFMCQPIGCTEDFRPLVRDPMGAFTVGWVGRPMSYRGVDIKRCEMAAEILEATKAECVLVGESLGWMVDNFLAHRAFYYPRPPGVHSDYPGLYAKMDALLVFSTTEAGPLCLFEALACGVPVVSTRVGWAPTMIEDGVNGFLVDSAAEAVARLGQVRDGAGAWRRLRRVISGTQPHRLEGWIDANLALALELAR